MSPSLSAEAGSAALLATLLISQGTSMNGYRIFACIPTPAPATTAQ
jgi:hypothetical protein